VGCRYICRDNDLLNCSIIFIIVAQYTQMNLKNRTALAEDYSEHSNSLNIVLKRNSELNYLLNVFSYITLHDGNSRPHLCHNTASTP
jgi:hypothetical protein